VLALRNDTKINVRQPLPKVLVADLDSNDRDAIQKMEPLILEETNVKAIEFIAGSSGLISKSAKPNFKILGSKLGPQMKEVNQIVRSWGDDDIKELESNGQLAIELKDGTKIDLTTEEIEIASEGIEGWLVGQQNGLTLALDTSISPELRQEGLARELVNRIQNLRKSSDFEVTDRIEISLSGTAGIMQAISEHNSWIKDQVLALKLDESQTDKEGELFEIGEENVRVKIKKIDN